MKKLFERMIHRWILWRISNWYAIPCLDIPSGSDESSFLMVLFTFIHQPAPSVALTESLEQSRAIPVSDR